MSSHSVKLASKLKEFQRIKAAYKAGPQTEYLRGLYNGLEMAWAIMCNTKPDYLQHPPPKRRKRNTIPKVTMSMVDGDEQVR